jgi:hypothetical protein
MVVRAHTNRYASAMSYALSPRYRKSDCLGSSNNQLFSHPATAPARYTRETHPRMANPTSSPHTRLKSADIPANRTPCKRIDTPGILESPRRRKKRRSSSRRVQSAPDSVQPPGSPPLRPLPWVPVGKRRRWCTVRTCALYATQGSHTSILEQRPHTCAHAHRLMFLRSTKTTPSTHAHTLPYIVRTMSKARGPHRGRRILEVKEKVPRQPKPSLLVLCKDSRVRG